MSYRVYRVQRPEVEHSSKGIPLKSATNPTHDAIDRYGSLVMQLVWRIVRDQEHARDIYQETFLRFHTAWMRGEDITHPKAWLCRTALNLAYNQRRQQDRETAYAEQVGWWEQAGSDGLEQAEHILLVDQVRRLVGRLPDRQRDVFVLRNFEGLSFSEIGELLDCTPETARANEYQALQKLRVWMHDSQAAKRGTG